MLLDNAELSKQAVAAVATAVVSSTFFQWAPLPSAQDAVKDSYWRSWIFHVNKLFGLLVWSLTIWYLLAPDSPARAPWTPGEVAAAVAALSGGLLRIWAVHTLDRYFTFQVTIREDHKLVDSGPYRLLLHPSYTGSVAGVAGLLWLLQGPPWLPINYRTPLLWALSVPAAGYIVAIRIRDEEAALAGHFKTAWERYKSTRWRVLPFIW